MDSAWNPAILVFIDQKTPVFLATVPATTVLMNLTVFPAHSASTSLPLPSVSQFVLQHTTLSMEFAGSAPIPAQLALIQELAPPALLAMPIKVAAYGPVPAQPSSTPPRPLVKIVQPIAQSAQPLPVHHAQVEFWSMEVALLPV